MTPEEKYKAMAKFYRHNLLLALCINHGKGDLDKAKECLRKMDLELKQELENKNEQMAKI